MSAASSLARRLMAIASLALVPVVALVLYNQWHDYARARQGALDENLRVARAIAAQRAPVFDGAQRLLMTLSRFPMILDEHPDHCRETLPSVLRDHPRYLNVSVMLADGTPFCSAAPLDDVSGRREWLSRVIAGQATVVGRYSVSPEAAVVEIAHPVAGASGDVSRVLVASMRLSEPQWFASRMKVPSGAELTLFDARGVVVASYPATAPRPGSVIEAQVLHARLLASGQETMTDATGRDGVKRVEITVPVESSVDTGLFLTLGLDRATAFEEAALDLRRQLSLLALVLLVGAAVVVIGGDRLVVDPLRHATVVLHRIAAGDFGARATISAELPAMSGMATAINAMGGALLRRQEERDRAEGALRASEEHYRGLFVDNPHSMLVIDAGTYRILAVNRTALQAYGYSEDEFLRMSAADLHPAGDALVIPVSTVPSAHWDCVGRHSTCDGRVIDVEVVGRRIKWRGRPAWLALIRDVTERKQLEEQLRQSQRMEAIGQLAGSVAHDFNNVLTAIQGFTLLLDDSIAAGAPDRDLVMEISRASARAADLTRQLLAFSRKQALSLRVLQLAPWSRRRSPCFGG